MAQENTVGRKPFYKRIFNAATNFVKAFNDYDTAYIEPQHYNYALMIQSTNSYERYELISKSGQSIVLAPNLGYKLGPYFGWRWIFLGFTFDVKDLHFSKSAHSAKKEFDASIYSSMIGVDFYYRRTGNDYKIRRVYLGDDVTQMILLIRVSEI